MPLLALILCAVSAGLLTLAAWLRYPRTSPERAAAEARAAVARRARSGRLTARLDPEKLTGLALSVALLAVLGGGLLLAMLILLVRTNVDGVRIDASVANWGDRHATAFSTHGLDAVTQLGSTAVTIGLAALLVLVETLRTRNRWIAPFVLASVAGSHLLTTTIKDLVDRARPALNPIAHTLGPSFPSGHTSSAATLYATAALVLARGRARRTRAVLAGAAVGIAVAVAASRVLLDVHWLTDVLGGLALGWAWFAICAIAFGSWLLAPDRSDSPAAEPPRGAGAAPGAEPARSPGARPAGSATGS